MWKNRLRVFPVCLVLQVGTFTQVPMRPDEIRELMNQMTQPKMAHVLPNKNDEGDEPLEPAD